jgi:hypothetical protein
LDEEHGNVVTHQIPIALFRVEFHRESTDVTRQIGRSLVTGDGRESNKRWRPFPGSLKDVRLGNAGERCIVFEKTMRSESTCMNHPFGYAFVVEMHNFLAKMKILQRKGAAFSNPQRILVVGNRYSLLGRQHGDLASSNLVDFAAISSRDGLIAMRAVGLVTAPLTLLILVSSGLLTGEYLAAANSLLRFDPLFWAQPLGSGAIRLINRRAKLALGLRPIG